MRSPVRLRTFAAAGRPLVLDEVAGRVDLEVGSPATLGDDVDRVAVVAHWSDRAQVSRSVRTLVVELAANGYRPVVVSAATVARPLDWSGALPAEAIVIRQPNVGYDFGSWAIGLHVLPQLASAERVLLINDSLAGPFAGISALLDRFDTTPVDVWSLTDTNQYFHHLQSYCLGFRGGVLAEPALRRFWTGIRQERSKWDIIRFNELGLNTLLYREGYSTASVFRADEIVGPGENPVIKGWWALLENGFPFVKREILRDPSVAPRGEWVAREVRAVFGVDVDDWL